MRHTISSKRMLSLVLSAGLLRAADGVVRENRADQQCESVNVDQAEMADGVKAVGVVQWQRYRHGDEWGEEGAPERPAHAVADSKPGQRADRDPEADHEPRERYLQVADVVIQLRICP